MITLNTKQKYRWNTYAFVVSIILGLIGFVGSFYSSRYGFNEFTINIIWSIILPILVVLAWGLRYGLLSITLGLTVLYPFFLGPYNGWASIIPVTSLYILIFMHGYGQEKRKESQKLIYNLYFIQVIYSIIRILLYLVFFPLLISLNATFWNSLVITDITLEIVLLFAVKGVLVEFILVALGDALLLLPFVRKLFRLSRPKSSRANSKIMAYIVVFGLVFTFLVLALNQYISLGYISVKEFFAPDDFTRSTLLLATILFIIMGGITVRYVEKMMKTQEALKERENQYRLANLEINLLNESLEQKVLSRTQALLEANHELEEFAYTISHDLKSPLRAIDGYGEFLILDHGEIFDEEAVDMVENIRMISQNMMGLINRLLEYSTLAKKELYLERVNLFDMATQLVKIYRVTHPNQNIELHLKGEPREIMGDKILLSQVIQNLFSNSVKFFNKEKNSIVLTIHGEVVGDSYHVSFQDNGLGFELMDNNQVFGIFQKLHKPTEYEGYGIGLSTVKKIILKHGGEVQITSKNGEGTTVFLMLPLHGQKEEMNV